MTDCGHNLKTHYGATCTRPGKPEFGGRCGQHRAPTAIEQAQAKEKRMKEFAAAELAMDLKEAQRAFLAAVLRQGLHMDDHPDVRETYTNFVKLLNAPLRFKPGTKTVPLKFKPGTECVNDLTSFSELGQGPLAERK